MKNRFPKCIALLLALLLALGMLPAALAAQREAGQEPFTMPATGLLPVFPHGGSRPGTGDHPQGENPQNDDLPAAYDSRDYGYITPVRDQGSYNTCWTFAAAASCEAYMIKHGVEVGNTGEVADQTLDLSEFHLAYYSYTAAYDAEGMLTGDRTDFLSSVNTNFLDQGGTGELVSYPLMRWTGLAAETEPALMYSSTNYGGLGADYAYQYNVAHVQSVKHFFGENVAEVKRHILEYGAGSMGVRVTNASGRAYHGGFNVDNGTICWIQPNKPYTQAAFYYADHDVTVVGWDDNFSRENFNQGYRPAHDGAWIVKNSWGTDVGDDGYFYVSYEDSATCATYISFFAVESVENYDHNYQYDGSGNYTSWENLTSGDAIAQSFVANGNETLEAVALGMCSDDTDFTLRVYTDCTVDDPTAGTLACTQTGNIDYWGYQTVGLEQPVTLTPGQRFAVVVEFGSDESLPLYDTTFSDNEFYQMVVTHTTHPNTAYCKRAGETMWTNTSADRNYRLKAFTKDVPEAPVPVTMHYAALGSEYDSVSGTAGDKITLLATAPAVDGWTFLGWVTAPVAETLEKPSFYKPGASFKLTASIQTLYALYLRTEPIDAPVTYELIDSLPDTWVGKYVFVATPITGNKEYAMRGVTANAEGTSFDDLSDGAAVDFASTGITRTGTTLSNVPEAYVFAIESTNYGMAIRSLSTGSYLASKHTGSTSTAYTLYALPAFSAENCTWIFELDDGALYLKHNHSGLVPYVAVSSVFGFSMTRYGSEFQFYKQNPTETCYYATEISGGTHTHNLIAVQAKAPTCTDSGNIAYWYCAGCGKYFSDADAGHEISQQETVLDALGHLPGQPTRENETAPTCTTAGGYDLVTHCQRCGELVASEHVTVDALGHDWDAWQTDHAPTCTETGTDFRLCRRCGEREECTVDALGHLPGQPTRENETAPTCTAAGGYDLVTRCQRCGELVTSEHVTVDALGHDWDAWQTDRAPTCTETGTDFRICRRCGEREECTVDALGHLPGQPTRENEAAPTCTAAGGYDLVTHCQRCGELVTSEHVTVDALGHDWDEGVVSIQPSEAADGERTYTCLRCGETKTEAISNNPFVDVKKGKYYYNAVLWAYYHNPQITSGTDATHFSPNADCTREQVMTFLWAAKGKPGHSLTENPFKDVKRKAYYYDAVMWAVENGITKGVSDNLFGVKQSCTREQVVTFLWTAAGRPEPEETECPFRDVKRNAYYYKAVLWAVQNGVTSGVSADAFGVKQPCTRSQIVVFLQKALALNP
ncbi:MAG: S-layer homology domain-containing protein [Oscillospiraceae bacterium]|nr:S-layer homology domain-containing protein [Oscillospiraceae bacterium]